MTSKATRFQKYIQFCYSDAINYSILDNGVIRKLAIYAILDISNNGYKEILTIEVGKNGSSKYQLPVLGSLKNRCVKNILIICADKLTDIKKAIVATFSKTKYQRYIVHQVRNTMKYMEDKVVSPSVRI